MLIYDDIYAYEGWGGKLKLGSGSCRLRLYDLKKGNAKGLAHLRPFIAIVSDIPECRLSVKSSSSHIATSVAGDFNIEPHRMMWIEYYPERRYGKDNERVIPEIYEWVEFEWHEGLAVHPKWRELQPQMLESLLSIITEGK